MLTAQAADLLDALRHTLAGWECGLNGDHVTFTGGTDAYRPRRHVPSWSELLNGLERACADNGLARAHPLPLHGLDDAELTFSAIQALDPYLKRRQHHTYGSGFLPQPVVRLNKRNEAGSLPAGFLTSFVNTSIVQPISSAEEHAALIDVWVSALSRLGFHVHALTITGSLATWRRAPVAGITLRIHHDGQTIGDAVMLWNIDTPTFLATDIGSGLERLAWALTRRPWPQTVHGTLASHADSRVLDAVRTATLIVGAGILPSSRGPGSAVRRLFRPWTARSGLLGLSKVVRWAHAYWSLVTPLALPWHEVCRILDAEAAAHEFRGWTHR